MANASSWPRFRRLRTRPFIRELLAGLTQRLVSSLTTGLWGVITHAWSPPRGWGGGVLGSCHLGDLRLSCQLLKAFPGCLQVWHGRDAAATGQLWCPWWDQPLPGSVSDGWAVAGQRRGGRKGVCWLSQLSLPLWSSLRGSLWLSHVAAEYLSLTGGVKVAQTKPCLCLNT